MKNNFVAKNDFNRASVHKDLKNEYDRSEEKLIIEAELEELASNASLIALEEYDRAVK